MLSSALRTSRLGIAALAAVVVTLLGAAPAMAAATVNVGSSNELFYDAASGEVNQITFSGDSTSLTLNDTGAAELVPGTGCAAVDLQTVTCAGVVKINVETGDLSDTVTNSTALISLIKGQNGDDVLNGGSGEDTLRGAAGNDTLNGNEGGDFLFGEDIPAQIGDDLLAGGDGLDWANYTSMKGVTVDLGNTAAQDTGAGMDTLSDIENVNGSTSADDLTGNAVPNRFVASGGDDVIRISDGGSDVANCGDGDDTVFLDRSDTVRFRNQPPATDTCETVDDNQDPDGTTITAGPSGLTNDPRWEFTSNEPWADFECAVVEDMGQLDTPSNWSTCQSGETLAVPEGPSIFAVRAVDDQGNQDPQAPPQTRSFSFDSVAPETRIDSGPSGGGVTSDSTPEFFFSSDDADTTGFLCRFDTGSFFICSSPLTADPLTDGEHTLEVAATDGAGNFDNTPAHVTFRVDTGGPGPAPGDGPAPNPQSPQVQQAKIIIGSLVLISGNAVRMSRKGRISISLTCAGAVKCSGRLSITTAKPVSKRSRKLVTLGAKKFTIAANKKRRINVKFSKRNIRLARRLKRFKAKALIREIDSRGNPRISSRLFILRAR